MVANQDRLSLLPDDLLFTIITLLPFKEALRTSILSTRWRFVPLGTRNMEFNENDFVSQAPVPDEIREEQRRVFVDFVLRWINGKYSNSMVENKFWLKFSHPEDHLLQMQQCIKFAIDSKVQVLDIDFSDPTWNEDDIDEHQHTFLQLPLDDGEFKSTLESLKLFSCNIPASFGRSQNFSALRSVSLGWITVTSSHIKNLLDKCPSLEILSMRRCCYIQYSEILGRSLKTLILEKCCSNEPDSMVQFLIDAPKLQLFKYSGVLCIIEFESSNLDLEADLDFGLQREFGEYGDILYQLLVQIASVKTLTVCTYMLQVITCGAEPFVLKPALGCVKHLILKATLNRDEFYGISFFLESCPNLEVLTIDLNTPARSFPEYDPPLDIHQHPFLMKSASYPLVYPCVKKILKSVVVNPCVKKKLKSVVVKGFKGAPNEVVVLGYLLKYGRVLDSMLINISKERGPDGTSMEATYVENVHSLVKTSKIANQRVQVFLSCRA